MSRQAGGNASASQPGDLTTETVRPAGAPQPGSFVCSAKPKRLRFLRKPGGPKPKREKKMWIHPSIALITPRLPGHQGQHRRSGMRSATACRSEAQQLSSAMVISLLLVFLAWALALFSLAFVIPRRMATVILVRLLLIAAFVMRHHFDIVAMKLPE